MKRILIALFLILLSSAAFADEITFADLKWGSAIDGTKNQLIKKGFKTTTDKDGDIKFEGTLLQQKAGGWAMFSNGKLAKVQVIIATPDNKAISTYRELKDVLTKKYGAPEDIYEFFQTPYFEGDGYSEQAIQLDKGHFLSGWQKKLLLSITDRLTVSLSYESDLWGAEADKRQAKKTEVF